MPCAGRVLNQAEEELHVERLNHAMINTAHDGTAYTNMFHRK